MREKTIKVLERDIVFAITGSIYAQAPNHTPILVDVINKKFLNEFRKIAKLNFGEYVLVETEKNFSKILKDILYGIPEFQNLNLSKRERDKNISFHDTNRPSYGFDYLYKVADWENDFIDLYSLLSNIENNFYMMIDCNSECVGCIHTNSDKCKNCFVKALEKPSYYESLRMPKGEYTFACKYDCVYSKYICCEECNKNNECESVCTSSCLTCGNAINKK